MRTSIFFPAIAVVCLVGMVACATPAGKTAAKPTSPPTVHRIACLGAEITAGAGTQVPVVEAYPAQLQRMLNPDEWWVRNFGINYAGLSPKADKRKTTDDALQDAIAFKPEILVILIGDAKFPAYDATTPDQLVASYDALIARFRKASPATKILLGRIPPPPPSDTRPSDPVLAAALPRMERGAGAQQRIAFDFNWRDPDEWSAAPSAPNAAGALRLARAVHRAIFERDFTGTQDSVVRSRWKGYRRFDFVVNGRAAYIIEPHSPANGRPWIWRPEFFGVEPQTELALLSQGWHAGYVDVRNLYGCPVALDAMDAFYDQVTRQYGLAHRVVLAGFSRGGLYAFNWAVRHPDRTDSIYVDAPVLDFKSWPAGRGKGRGSSGDWERLLSVYHLTEKEALEYPGNPIDTLPVLAEHHIPIISVCGGADTTVPMEENTGIAAERYQKLGGVMQVIVKPGGEHHPHSLPDPTPIVEFIVEHSQVH